MLENLYVCNTVHYYHVVIITSMSSYCSHVSLLVC